MSLGIRALCSDLDGTLYDCDKELESRDYWLARQTMEDAGLDDGLLCEMDELYKTTSFVEILKILEREPYSVDKRILMAGYNCYNNLEFGEITPSPDVILTLETIKQYGIKTALVTMGMPERQQKKVRVLGVEDYFDELFFVSDFSSGSSKGYCFRCFADKNNIPYSEVMVIGDKISKEIKEGNELGMTTVQILQGRHAERTPTTPLEVPNHEISSFSKILDIIGIAE